MQWTADVELPSCDHVDGDAAVAVTVLGTSHDLTAASHVGGTQRTCLASLLAQGARHAEEVHAAIAERRALDVLGLADVGADAALTEEADARTADEQQRVAAA